MENKVTALTSQDSQNGLVSISSTGMSVKPLPVKEAILNGTMLTGVARKHPQQAMMYLVTHIIRTVKAIEAKTTAKDADEIELIARSIIEQYPTLRCEELQQVFDNMILGKYGKYYERLKAAEFMEAFRQYDQSDERLTAFETRHKTIRVAIEIRTSKQWYMTFAEVERRGYKLREDRTPEGKLDLCYVVVENGVYDRSLEPRCEVVMTPEQWLQPVRYDKGQERMDTSKLSSSLRKALTVDPRVMAEYMNQKQQ